MSVQRLRMCVAPCSTPDLLYFCRSNYWGQEGYGNHGNYNEADLREAYRTLLDLDLTFIDTAEVSARHQRPTKSLPPP